jgi:hypothetical protein
MEYNDLPKKAVPVGKKQPAAIKKYPRQKNMIFP